MQGQAGCGGGWGGAAHRAPPTSGSVALPPPRLARLAVRGVLGTGARQPPRKRGSRPTGMEGPRAPGEAGRWQAGAGGSTAAAALTA